MKKRKKVAAKKRVKRVAEPRTVSPGLPYKIHAVGKSFEVRNPAKEEVFGPYSTRERAERAIDVLNKLPSKQKVKPRSAIFD